MRKARSKRVLVSIPSEVGRGRAREHGLYPSTPRPVCFVSIPSEVGRGRAPYHRIFSRDRWSSVSFQSPRRWGGVGRLSPKRSSKACSFRFNPLGGGAGSGSRLLGRALLSMNCVCFNPLGGGAGSGSRCSRSGRQRNLQCGVLVSIPSEVGRGRAPRRRPGAVAEAQLRFNPLGGRAGPGSRHHVFLLLQDPLSITFQSPRRWGGVGLSGRFAAFAGNRSKFQSPRRWGGVGLRRLAPRSPTGNWR